ncbi:hypothetical protein M431DRAFT_482100 [Trichoderma harzianum CBS 226.95]|uniref:Uncharacterized protein n=1 Tax=Trichoderma harzianum CBS 226.95 TaxID=983964 RepID=A0A2T4ACV7_TRIHA|nr:hypothetical protein M431DRAFT_482100 [Trichoderma harzianum CBS 226.95]PTB54924.1 hypothetical protein M431DRAFT_482100 [Trichoderma harzianum CBS 226.95]
MSRTNQCQSVSLALSLSLSLRSSPPMQLALSLSPVNLSKMAYCLWHLTVRLGSPSMHYCRHDDIGSSRNRLSGRHLAVPDCCREARAELQALIQKAACDRPPWNQGQPFRQFQPMQSERHNTLTKRHHSQKVRARDVQAADQPPTGPTGKEENTNKTNHES